MQTYTNMAVAAVVAVILANRVSAIWNVTGQGA